MSQKPLNSERGLQYMEHGHMHSLFTLRVTLEAQDRKVDNHYLFRSWGTRGPGRSVNYRQSQEWCWRKPSKPQVLAAGTLLLPPSSHLLHRPLGSKLIRQERSLWRKLKVRGSALEGLV